MPTSNGGKMRTTKHARDVNDAAVVALDDDDDGTCCFPGCEAKSHEQVGVAMQRTRDASAPHDTRTAL
jgi:hypothetical protein